MVYEYFDLISPFLDKNIMEIYGVGMLATLVTPVGRTLISPYRLDGLDRAPSDNTEGRSPRESGLESI